MYSFFIYQFLNICLFLLVCMKFYKRICILFDKIFCGHSCIKLDSWHTYIFKEIYWGQFHGFATSSLRRYLLKYIILTCYIHCTYIVHVIYTVHILYMTTGPISCFEFQSMEILHTQWGKLWVDTDNLEIYWFCFKFFYLLSICPLVHVSNLTD